MTPTPRRNTTLRDRHRKQIARGKPPCHICGEPIDYTLPHYDAFSFVVDHIIPLHHGGADDLHNKAAAHRCCNRTKGATVPGAQPLPPGVVFVTTRRWW